MTHKVTLTINGLHDTKQLDFEVLKIVLTGRTSRDPKEVKKHLDELRKAGANLSESKEVVVYHPKVPEGITTGERFEVLEGSKTSGEVEYVLFLDKGNIYVGLGSDHTDRELINYSSTVAKQIYPTVIAPNVWRFEDVQDNWDDIIMRSWVFENGQRELYQEDKLEKMLRPEDIMEKVRAKVFGDMNGMIILGGTFATIKGEISFSSTFEMELFDPNSGRSIKHFYSAEPMTWFKKQAFIKGNKEVDFNG